MFKFRIGGTLILLRKMNWNKYAGRKISNMKREQVGNKNEMYKTSHIYTVMILKLLV